MKRFWCIKWAWLMSLVSCVMPQQSLPLVDRDPVLKRVRESGKISILFVGNSYSFGLPKAFTKEALSQQKTVRVGHSTYGGWKLSQHATHQPTLHKIRTGQWDIVVLQEQSEIPAMPAKARDAEMLPALKTLVKEVTQVGALPLLYQTWGRKNGHASQGHGDFYEMNARLREGYHTAASRCGGLLVVPVGDAWQREVAVGHADRLFINDGSHPAQGGNELTARVFYETIFGESR